MTQPFNFAPYLAALTPTPQEIREYRTEHACGLADARKDLTRVKLERFLQTQDLDLDACRAILLIMATRLFR